jgi:hypothetical protein
MFVKIVGLEARAVARWGIKETNREYEWMKH